jgi:hypothetical protein
MAEVSTKIKFLLFILVISLLINTCIGVTSMVINNSDAFVLSGFTNQSQNKSQSLGLLGLISIPAFVLPYISIVSLYSLNMPTEVFAFCMIIIGIIETLKLFLYFAIVWNFIPFTNT